MHPESTERCVDRRKLLLERDPRWFVVPNYEDGSGDARVVNRVGEEIATFDQLDEAEAAVDAYNKTVAPEKKRL